jgi:hypothetical protein
MEYKLEQGETIEQAAVRLNIPKHKLVLCKYRPKQDCKICLGAGIIKHKIFRHRHQACKCTTVPNKE